MGAQTSKQLRFGADVIATVPAFSSFRHSWSGTQRSPPDSSSPFNPSSPLFLAVLLLLIIFINTVSTLGLMTIMLFPAKVSRGKFLLGNLIHVFILRPVAEAHQLMAHLGVGYWFPGEVTLD